MTKISRNAPCPCGSGKKYKKCCLGKEEPLRSVTESGAPAPPKWDSPSNPTSRGSSSDTSPYVVLEEALARPVTDAAYYDLELRLSDRRRTSPPEDEDFQA